MLTRSIPLTAFAGLLLPAIAAAEPITLKLAFFTSDRSNIYQCQFQPFVDAVNREGRDELQIEVKFGAGQFDQLRMLQDGTTDIAGIRPANSPEHFPDKAVLQLPGLFQNQTEASLVFSELIASGTLRGYQDLAILRATVSADQSIHSRKPIAALADLHGQTIRVNNEIEATTLKKLGAAPVLLPINQTMDNLAQGKIDGATMPVGLLFEFGAGRLTVNHYLLELGPVPTVLAMNRTKFASLPANAKNIIRKYTGAWLNEQSTSCLDSKAREVVAQLKADARRKVTYPSQADQATASRVYAEVADDWEAQSPRNRELLALVKAEIAKVRARK